MHKFFLALVLHPARGLLGDECKTVVHQSPRSSRHEPFYCDAVGTEPLAEQRVDPASEFAATRCCGLETAISVCGNAGTWCDYVTWSEAEALCAAEGARLCTVEELHNGAGWGTGCNFDAQFLWSSEGGACDGSDGYLDAAGSLLFDGCQLVVHQHPRDEDKEDDTCGVAAPVAQRPVSRSEQAAGARCCEPEASVCPGETCALYTYDEAKQLCEDAGSRLCTAAELHNGAGIGTGCNFDVQYLWTSDSAPCPSADSAPRAAHHLAVVVWPVLSVWLLSR